jgi:predicted porin
VHFRVRDDSGSMTTYEANEVFQLTPATTLMGGYWYSKLEGQKWQNVTVLLDYALSKRTDVYTSATYLRASGGAAPVFANGEYVSTGQSSTAVRVGIRTLFWGFVLCGGVIGGSSDDLAA